MAQHRRWSDGAATAASRTVNSACILSAGALAHLISDGQQVGDVGQIAAKLLAVFLVLLILRVAARRSIAAPGTGFVPNNTMITVVAALVAVSVAAVVVGSLGRPSAGLMTWLLAWWLLTVVLVLCGNLLACQVIGRLSRMGVLARRLAIVGASRDAERFIQAISPLADDIKVVGVFDDRAPDRRCLRFECEGSIAELIRLAHRSQLDQIIVALPVQAGARLAEVLHRLKQVPVRVSLAPGRSADRLPPQAITRVAGISMVDLAVPPLTRLQRLTKEAMDRTLSLLFLVLLAPCFLAIAVIIRLEGPGPVFFVQERYGLGNQVIRVHKFRTMRTELSDPDCCHQTRRDDPRLTRVGGFLRRTSLDELPQLWNVLVGDMSLVGPRPHAVGMLVAGRPNNEVDPSHLIRHRVKPGITGLAQVNGFRGGIETPLQLRERLRHDLKYIEEWSIWLDLAIILCTAFVILSRKNAF